MMTVIGIILIVAAVFLIVAVLMQHGKSHNLSGTIAGASETFFGKSKANTLDHKLSIITTIVAIIFVVLVLVVYLISDNNTVNAPASTGDAHVHDVVDTSDDASDDTADDTSADTTADTTADASSASEPEAEPTDTAARTSEPQTTADNALIKDF